MAETIGTAVLICVIGGSALGAARLANPAVTIARMLTTSQSGIAPLSMIPFVLIQLAAGLAAGPLATHLSPQPTAQPSTSRSESAI